MEAAKDALVLTWTVAPFRAELLVATVSPELPAGMAVEKCQIAVWHVHARSDTEQCVFDARWAGNATPPEGGPSSGQALNALTWSDGSVELSLGAPDAEALQGYDKAGIPMPLAWRELLEVEDATHLNVEDYFSNGLRLRLPDLRSGESACLHFAAAWADANANEDAAWFAVDLPPTVVRSYLDQMPNAP